MRNDVATQIERFNAGRDPERLALKMNALRNDPFRFLRGTCHLFYADVPDHPVLRSAPRAWACGDLHIENFGSFKGENRLPYFDLNDFDEALLAPTTWDPWRCVASILTASDQLGTSHAQSRALCRTFVDRLGTTMASGKAYWVERATSTGLVRTLLSNVRRRNRRKFLDQRTQRSGGERRLHVDGKRALPASAEERGRAAALVAAFAQSRADAEFFRILDVARRIAGTGSLGLERYIVLVEGRGSPDGNFLVDVKQSPPPSAAATVPVRQPRWPSEAARVVAVQYAMEAVPPALLGAVDWQDRSYLVRELQPLADRVDLSLWDGHIDRLHEVIGTMADVTAWGQLRAAGRFGAASPEALVAWYSDARWKGPLLEIAQHSAAQVRAQWQAFRDRDHP